MKKFKNLFLIAIGILLAGWANAQSTDTNTATSFTAPNQTGTGASDVMTRALTNTHFIAPRATFWTPTPPPSGGNLTAGSGGTAYAFSSTDIAIYTGTAGGGSTSYGMWDMSNQDHHLSLQGITKTVPWSKNVGFTVGLCSQGSFLASSGSTVLRVLLGQTASITTLTTTYGMGLEFRMIGSGKAGVYAFYGNGSAITYSSELFQIDNSIVGLGNTATMTLISRSGVIALIYNGTEYATGLTQTSSDISYSSGCLMVAGVSNDSTTVQAIFSVGPVFSFL